MEQMHTMLQNVHKSIEAQDQKRKDYEADIKAYAAETQRISAVQAGMSEEQISDIVMGTLHGMMTSGDLVGNMPSRESPEMGEMPPEMPPEMGEMPPQGGMQ
jgi:hypothetical protein